MTAPALEHGVPGIEGLHTLTPPSPFSPFTLNDWMDPSTGNVRQWTTQAAHTFLTGVTGLHDKPDADDPRVNLNYEQGELPLPRYGRGRTITYSGIVVGETLADLRALESALRACCSNALTDPTAWSVVAAYDTTYDPTGLTFVGYGIPLGFTCDDTQGAPTLLPSPYQRAFDLTFRQSEGRWWVTSDAQSIGWDGDTYVGIDGGTATVLTMPGTAPSEPVFTLQSDGDGSATLILSAAELNAQLQIVLPDAMASGDQLVVDFGRRAITFTPSGGAAVDYTGYLDTDNSNWWDEASSVWAVASGGSLLPGANTLNVVGNKWAATAVPAVW